MKRYESEEKKYRPNPELQGELDYMIVII